MKNKVKASLIKIFICAFLLSNLSGCWSAREINDLEIVVGMGIDKDKTSGNIRLTAQVVKPGEMRKPSPEGGVGGGGKAFWDVNSTEKTVFEAVRDITHKTGNRLFVSHSQVVVFGKDIASEGLQKYMDFFLRAHEMRPTALILVSEGTAEEILDIKPEKEKLPAMNMAKLVKSYGFTSQYPKVNFQDFSNRLLSKTTSPVAPLVRIASDNGKKNIYVAGTAVFKNAKMVGTLSKPETRGLLWVTGKVKSGVIDVDTPTGQGKAVLEILKAKSKVTPEIKDGKLYIHVEIKEEASLSEQTTPENLATVPAFEMMQESQAVIIRQEIMEAFEKSKELNSDVFGFGDLVHKKYRKEWKQLEGKWDEIYPTIELLASIETKIRKTDLITKPAVPEKEGQQ